MFKKIILMALMGCLGVFYGCSDDNGDKEPSGGGPGVDDLSSFRKIAGTVKQGEKKAEKNSYTYNEQGFLTGIGRENNSPGFEVEYENNTVICWYGSKNDNVSVYRLENGGVKEIKICQPNSVFVKMYYDVEYKDSCLLRYKLVDYDINDDGNDSSVEEPETLFTFVDGNLMEYYKEYKNGDNSFTERVRFEYGDIPNNTYPDMFALLDGSLVFPDLVNEAYLLGVIGKRTKRLPVKITERKEFREMVSDMRTDIKYKLDSQGYPVKIDYMYTEHTIFNGKDWSATSKENWSWQVTYK